MRFSSLHFTQPPAPASMRRSAFFPHRVFPSRGRGRRPSRTHLYHPPPRLRRPLGPLRPASSAENDPGCPVAPLFRGFPFSPGPRLAVVGSRSTLPPQPKEYTMPSSPRRHHRSRRFRPVLEPLERRDVPAVTIL